MCEEHGGAITELRLDVLGEHLRLHLVRQEERDQLRAAHRLGDRLDLEPRLLCVAPRRRALAQADDHLDTGVVQVERVGVTLAPVADNGNRAVEEREIAVAEDRGHTVSFRWMEGEV